MPDTSYLNVQTGSIELFSSACYMSVENRSGLNSIRNTSQIPRKSACSRCNHVEISLTIAASTNVIDRKTQFHLGRSQKHWFNMVEEVVTWVDERQMCSPKGAQLTLSYDGNIPWSDFGKTGISRGQDPSEWRSLTHILAFNARARASPCFHTTNAPYKYSINESPKTPRGRPPLSHWCSAWYQGPARWASIGPPQACLIWANHCLLWQSSLPTAASNLWGIHLTPSSGPQVANHLHGNLW